MFHRRPSPPATLLPPPVNIRLAESVKTFRLACGLNTSEQIVASRTGEQSKSAPGRRPNVAGRFLKLICVMAAAGSSLFWVGCATPAAVNGVPNFAAVAPGVFRGGQPNEAGWQFLRSLGVPNIVKLNRETADPPPAEMNAYFIPLPPATVWEWFQQPRSNDVWRAVQVLKFGGTYVHCQHGRDRTGLVIGCYRLWHDGWSEAAAAREMSALGYHWSIPGLTAFWKSVTVARRCPDDPAPARP